MPTALSQSLKQFGSCRSPKRLRALSVTVCVKDNKRSLSNARTMSVSDGDNDSYKSGNASVESEDRKLRRGSVLIAENADGSVTFKFHPDVTLAQVGSQLSVVSLGKQRKLLAKLRRIANGESTHSQLSYQLWDAASKIDSPPDESGSAADQSYDVAQTPDRVNGTAHRAATCETTDRPDDRQQRKQLSSSSGSTTQRLSLLLGQPASSSDMLQHPDLGNQYSFAATRDSATAGQDSSQAQPPLLPKPRGMTAAARGSLPAQGSSSARPALRQKPTRPTPLGRDIASSQPQFDRNAEPRVPCYLWHESGVPTRVDLRSFPEEGPEESDESVSTSDSPATIADSGAGFGQHPQASTNVQKAWAPIRQLLLKLWRVFPYWFRKLIMRSRQQQIPEVHASPILAQHTMNPRGPVEGSSYDITTGRSPTPLIDLERFDIEQLVDMGVGDVGLYRTALTSPSSVKFDDALAHSFDRLEFLGDSVVNLAFKSWVYNRFPKDDEGSMTNTANTLLSNRAHVQYANQLHLTSYIAQNLNLLRPTARVDEDVIADAFEALVGAIYLDKGLKAASDFIIKLAEEVMGLESDLSSYRNYKLYLVNNVNDADMGRVSYVSKKRGENMWQSKCRLQGKLLGIGLDKQRKQAESAAAYAAMEQLGFKDYAVEPVGLRHAPGAPTKPSRTFLGPSSSQPSSQSAGQAPSKSAKQQMAKKL